MKSKKEGENTEKGSRPLIYCPSLANTRPSHSSHVNVSSPAEAEVEWEVAWGSVRIKEGRREEEVGGTARPGAATPRRQEHGGSGRGGWRVATVHWQRAPCRRLLREGQGRGGRGSVSGEWRGSGG